MEKASRTPTQATWIGSRLDLLACCHHGRVSGWRLNIRRGAARYVRSHQAPVRISHTPAWRSLSLVADRGADSDKRPDCAKQNSRRAATHCRRLCARGWRVPARRQCKPRTPAAALHGRLYVGKHRRGGPKPGVCTSGAQTDRQG